MSLNLGNTKINEIYMGSTKIGSAYLGSSLIYQSRKPGITIDLNNQGTECTQEFLTQTSYPGVWTGYRVFRLGNLYTQRTHYYNYIKNLSNLSSNFVMYYFFAMKNHSANAYGKAIYSADSSNCVAQTTGWLSAGYDSQKPQYDKDRRYRNVTVNVSKGGNINWDFYYGLNPWYGNSIYYAIPEGLVETVINSM